MVWVVSVPPPVHWTFSLTEQNIFKPLDRIHKLTHEVPKGLYGPRKNWTPEDLLEAHFVLSQELYFFPLNTELSEPQPSEKKLPNIAQSACQLIFSTVNKFEWDNSHNNKPMCYGNRFWKEVNIFLEKTFFWKVYKLQIHVEIE